jgi:hypothetical protein
MSDRGIAGERARERGIGLGALTSAAAPFSDHCILKSRWHMVCCRTPKMRDKARTSRVWSPFQPKWPLVTRLLGLGRLTMRCL